ncbi:hypothetical protein [Ekhidna sp.]|uniref:sialidase family protein n=1 Tax=Ekhidna sp. TaxID=2608089 RepID=UPI003CCBAEF8
MRKINCRIKQGSPYAGLLLILCIVLISGFVSCREDCPITPMDRSLSFESFGLEGETVNEIRIFENQLIAATTSGLFITNIDEPNWQSMTTLSGKNLKAIEFLSSTHWIVSEWELEDGNLYFTKDGGRSWNLLENNFGREYDQNILDLEYDHDQKRLYATGYFVVAYSDDSGETWKTLIGDWDYLATGLDFVEKHPNKNELWTGGQNAIEGIILCQYNLNSGTENCMIDLLDPVSSAKDVLFDEEDTGFVMVGAEAGITVSRDGGATWQLSKNDRDNYKFTFGLEKDFYNSNIIYSGGWLKKGSDKPQPLVLSVSNDNGQTWSDHTFSDDKIYGGVLDMTSYIDNGNQSLFLGLDKGGVYRVHINRPD